MRFGNWRDCFELRLLQLVTHQQITFVGDAGYGLPIYPGLQTAADSVGTSSARWFEEDELVSPRRSRAGEGIDFFPSPQVGAAPRTG